MGAVHLRVVKLKRNRQIIPKPPLFIASPNHKRIIENPAVHAHRTVNFRVNNRRSADNYAVGR